MVARSKGTELDVSKVMKEFEVEDIRQRLQQQ
jgi:hypothetical protein